LPDQSLVLRGTVEDLDGILRIEHITCLGSGTEDSNLLPGRRQVNEIIYKSEFRVPFAERAEQVGKSEDHSLNGMESMEDPVVLLRDTLIRRIDVERLLAVVLVHDLCFCLSDDGAARRVHDGRLPIQQPNGFEQLEVPEAIDFGVEQRLLL